MMDIYNFSLSKANEITSHCVSWCREQHYKNEYENLWLLFISLTGMIMAQILYMNADLIAAKTPYAEDQIQRCILLGIDIGTWMLIIWFIMFFFF